MNKLITIISVALLAIITTPAARAVNGDPSYNSVAIGLPAVIPVANSPSNFPTPILLSVGKQNLIGTSFTVSSKDSGSTTNVTFKAAWAIDATFTGTNWAANADTNNAITLTACVNGVTPLVTATNTLSSNGRGYLYIYQESIGANSQITNNAAWYANKISAP